MRILVTGSEGTIGRHLCAYLSAIGHEVSRSDLAISDDPDYYRCDVSISSELYGLFEATRPEVVYHLAAECGIVNCEEHPEKAYITNVIGTLNVASECLSRDCQLINFSTSEVYGGPVSYAIPAYAPRNFYAHTKLSAEAVVNHLRGKGLKAVNLRPFMVYGPGENPCGYRSAVVRFVKAALNDEPMTVHHGSERAWTHIDDFVRGCALLIGKVGDIDLGNDDYRPIRELASLVIERCGGGSIVDDVSPQPNRVMVKRGDFDRMKHLGWEPHVSLEDGIDSVIAWVRSCSR